jgi:hypothetical protein
MAIESSFYPELQRSCLKTVVHVAQGFSPANINIVLIPRAEALILIHKSRKSVQP